jgi:hypothetical protein
MSGPREGGCACGEVRYRLASEPLFVHCCHCLNCQRQTGSAFVINLLIETDRVELTAGTPEPIDVPRDDGSSQRIFRCPTCQVALFSEYGHPGIRFVRAGTLDDPRDIRPDVHIFTKSKVSWVTLPESVPAFEIYYEPRSLWPSASLERLDAILAATDTQD